MNFTPKVNATSYSMNVLHTDLSTLKKMYVCKPFVYTGNSAPFHEITSGMFSATTTIIYEYINV